MRQQRPAESQNHDGRPIYRVTGDLYVDDRHWRGKTVISGASALVAGLAARRTHGALRVVYCVAAGVLVLPALSIALFIAVARRLEKWSSRKTDSPGFSRSG